MVPSALMMAMKRETGSATARQSIKRLSGRSITRLLYFFFFFFQAEDGIRDYKVTGVQTCALPICSTLTACHEQALRAVHSLAKRAILYANRLPGCRHFRLPLNFRLRPLLRAQIGRASCRERV